MGVIKNAVKPKLWPTFFLTLLMLFSLIGCSDDSHISSESNDSVPVVSESAPTSISTPEASIPEEPAPEATIPEESASGELIPEESAPEASASGESTFSIHFIDVGQADAALVECDGKYMLIDGGNKEDSNVIHSVLKKADVKHLEMVVGTHAHEDHIGGLPGAYSYTTADITLCPVESYNSDAFRDFAEYAEKNGGGITVPSVGDSYKLGSATVTILGVNGGSDTNDTSIVLKIQYGETVFLFTGDAEREAEQAILASGADLSATVLKVGHHGSETSTSYLFLREIMPAYAVISVGKGNTYGHPTEDALSRLRDAGAKVYRTDLQGDIRCTSDGKTVSLEVERNADADTLAPAANNTQSSSSDTKNDSKTEPAPTPDPTPAPQPDPVPDGPYYILNTGSKKFHESDCDSADEILSSNKEYYTGTAEELMEKGYSPCGNCEPYEEPEPEPAPAPAPSESKVWVSKTGKKYHSSSDCSNMKNASQISKSQAISKGLSACSKCW